MIKYGTTEKRLFTANRQTYKAGQDCPAFKTKRMKRKMSYEGEFVFALGDVPKINVPEIKLRYVSQAKKSFSEKITTSKDAEKIFRKLISKEEIELREQVIVLYLNYANKVIGYYRHTTGGITSSIVDTRLILATALKSLSTSIILCHNHPSGNLNPSEADIRLTKLLKDATKLMEIALLDHIIITRDSYYSISDAGDLSLSGFKNNSLKIMKTPITYYGGKQMMVKYLLELIPAHRIYCEPFFGGGALFFAKPKSEVEVINDKNGEVINFFKVIKTKFSELQKEIQSTLHSRELYKKAMVVYEHPDLFSDVKRAWALWTLTNQGFAGMIGSWGFGKTDSKEKSLSNKRDDFTKAYEERLRTAQIESNDAIKVIDRCDSNETFIYADPPYIGSDMGHYKGYSEADYKDLLDKLVKVKGKFLLSSYPSPILSQYIKKYNWKIKKVEKSVAVTKHTDKKKTEMLVFNFDPAKIKRVSADPKIKNISVKEMESKLKRLTFAA